MLNRYMKLMEAVLDDAVTAGASAAATDTGATNPPADEMEDYGYPYADDPRYAGDEGEAKAAVTEDASKEDAATSGQEPTEEEKALDAELQRLATEKPDATLPNHLRNVAKGALRGKREAEAERDELRTQLESAQRVTFRPTVPVEEFDAHKFTGEIFEQHPAYYPAIVEDVIKTHLDPARIQAEPQYTAAVMPLLVEAFESKWLPEFIQRNYGMDLQTFAARVDQAFSANPQTGQSPPANSSSQQIIEKYSLNPEEHSDLITALTASEQTNRQLAQLQQTVLKLQENQGNGSKQKEEAQATSRLQTFDSMVTGHRQEMLDLFTKGLPRDASGQIMKEFAHLPKKIDRLARVELDEDNAYKATRDHAGKWFKQPGTAESARTLAGGDLKAIFAKHQAIYQRIAQEELAPHVSLIDAKKKVEQTQRTQNPVRGGESPPAHTAPAMRQTNGRRPLTLAERAQQAYDSSRP